MNNIYWPVYKNIETEMNNLMFHIHFDDEQLNVYSSKISDLILRASTEIESLSKELYYSSGGTSKGHIKYDEDALKYLNQLWKLESKQVILSSYNCFISNKILEPFKKNEKKTGSNKMTYSWNNSYQNLKHDRSNSLKFGSIKYLLDATAALYILNIYYKNESYQLGQNSFGINFENSLGSSIFSIKLHVKKNQLNFKKYLKEDDFDECVYLLKLTDESNNNANKAFEEFNKEQLIIIANTLKNELGKLPSENVKIENKDIEELTDKIKNLRGQSIVQAAQTKGKMLSDTLMNLQHEAVLNKNQL